MKMLVTGGTVFVSRRIAEFFCTSGNEVFVLNRNTRAQVPGVQLIQADRHSLVPDSLSGYDFDAVIDVCAYTEEDARILSSALGKNFSGEFIFISSSAVYPETNIQPFSENQQCGANSVWGDYGTNKILCEKYYSSIFPNTYIIRPPYLYGQGNNVYREAFAFDCADFNRTFYLPENGTMKMQFFHIDDLCRFIHILLEQKSEKRIFNVGNAQSISVKEWVNLCYAAAGKTPAFKSVDTSVPQRNYFCFHKYEYALDVSRMSALMPETISLSAGLNKSYDWYKTHKDEVNRRDYFNYIDNDLKISEKSNVKA